MARVPKSHKTGAAPAQDPEGFEGGPSVATKAHKIKEALSKKTEAPASQNRLPVFDKKVWFAQVRNASRKAQNTVMDLAATYQGLASGVALAAQLIEGERGAGSFDTRLYEEVLNSAFALQCLSGLLQDNLPEETHAAVLAYLQERLFRAPAFVHAQPTSAPGAPRSGGAEPRARAQQPAPARKARPATRRPAAARRGRPQLPDVQQLVDVLTSGKVLKL